MEINNISKQANAQGQLKTLLIQHSQESEGITDNGTQQVEK
jgi:hypothetical protein